jgi:phosphate:Na+ symporter
MELNWGTLLVQVFGGLAIFLYGMSIMTDGLKLVAGIRLKNFLARMTSNRWKGLLAGASITSVIQSSSVTTVLVVGFVSAGLMSFENTLGIILGANIGTTITAQIIAFKITKAALVFVIIGFLLNSLSKQKQIRHTGLVILGLGFVFLGMSLMSKGTSPLRDYEPFVNLMQGLDNPFWGILIGALFTATVQSSSATTGIVIVMASQGLLNIEGGIALIIGANIGTCVTAFLSALGKPKVAMQVAVAHILFNILGAMLWLAFIPSLATLTENISPNNLPRQIANAHTIFNILNTFIFIGFTKQIAKLVYKIVPVEVVHEGETVKLERYYLKDISMALEMVSNNIENLSKVLINKLNDASKIALTGKKGQIKSLANFYSTIESCQVEILEYLGELQKKRLTNLQMQEVRKHVETINVIKMISILISQEMVEATELRLNKKFNVSAPTVKIIQKIYNDAIQSLETAFKHYHNGSDIDEENFEKTRSAFNKKLNKAHKQLISRLVTDDTKRISIFKFETEMYEIASRIIELSYRISNTANSY